uniref:Uncharacterized protein n=1 Tax=Romanomermis culicivorax TaxID=13658 RepID=A0A915ILS1_ROMCU
MYHLRSRSSGPASHFCTDGFGGRMEKLKLGGPFFTMIDVDRWVLVFWEEASVNFKNWWKSQWGEQYPARMKPFWGFMECLRLMLKNPLLADKQLASHLWNILLPSARAKWTNTDHQYMDQRVGWALPGF